MILSFRTKEKLIVLKALREAFKGVEVLTNFNFIITTRPSLRQKGFYEIVIDKK